MTRAAAPPVILERWMADLIDLFSPRTRPQILITDSDSGRRRRAGARPAHRDRGPAGHGVGTGAAFTSYHRILNRNAWSSHARARRLIALLVRAFVPDGPIVVGLDDTLERRRGATLAAKGIYRDPVRSSHSHFVKASGLRWLSWMLLAPVPWAGRVWALPVLTVLPVLAPSERYHQQRGLPPTRPCSIGAGRCCCNDGAGCPNGALWR